MNSLVSKNIIEKEFKNGKSIVKQIILNFKTVFTNIENVFIIFGMAFFISFLPIIFIPLKDSFGLVNTLLTIFTSMVIFNFVVSNYRKSTLKKNFELTSSNRWTFYISALITTTLISYFISIFYILLMQIYSWSGILLIKIWSSSNDSINTWGSMYKLYKLPIIYYFYEITLIIFICFSISFAIHSSFDDIRISYGVIVILLFLTIVFGGGLNNYFKTPYSFVDENGIKGSVPVFDYKTSGMFPPELYYPSMIFYPLLAPSLHLTRLGEYIRYNSDGVVSWGIYENYKIWFWATRSFYDVIGATTDKPISWNILWFVPYFHIVFWITIGLMVNFFKKRK